MSLTVICSILFLMIGTAIAFITLVFGIFGLSDKKDNSSLIKKLIVYVVFGLLSVGVLIAMLYLGQLE